MDSDTPRAWEIQLPKNGGMYITFPIKNMTGLISTQIKTNETKDMRDKLQASGLTEEKTDELVKDDHRTALALYNKALRDKEYNCSGWTSYSRVSQLTGLGYHKACKDATEELEKRTKALKAAGVKETEEADVLYKEASKQFWPSKIVTVDSKHNVTTMEVDPDTSVQSVSAMQEQDMIDEVAKVVQLRSKRKSSVAHPSTAKASSLSILAGRGGDKRKKMRFIAAGGKPRTKRQVEEELDIFA